MVAGSCDGSNSIYFAKSFESEIYILIDDRAFALCGS